MDNTKSIGIPKRHEPATVVEFKVRVGDSVDRQAPLLVYEYKKQISEHDPEAPDLTVFKALNKQANADGTYSLREFLRTPFEGTVTSIGCQAGDSVRHGEVLVEIEMPCAHGAVFNGLCGLCGQDVSGVDKSGVPRTQANIDMFHEATGLRVSTDVAAAIDADTQSRLWKHRKLSLIIDLDQTIIHATDTSNPHFGSWLSENYQGPEHPDSHPPSDQQLPPDIRSFFLPRVIPEYFIKLRPGLRNFLETISAYYEMHIYTMGTRPYADAVAAIVDPQGRYFGRRILSRDESGSQEVKNLQRLFPVDTSMVTILDDRADVWKWSPNLIKVHPYEFFRGVGDINAGRLGQHRPSAALLEPTPEGESSTGNHPQAQEEIIEAEPAEPADGPEASGKSAGKRKCLVDRDRELFIIEKVLISIHAQYYELLAARPRPPPDLAHILAREKQRVLAGVTLVFSGVFPIDPGAPPPQQTELWWRAQSFGARCELEITDQTTHVVAGRVGTEKVHAARRRHRSRKSPEASLPIVVKPKWLQDSIYEWKRMDETMYLWFDEDKDAVSRLRDLQLHDSPASGKKRKSEDSGISTADRQDRAPLVNRSVQRVREENGYESSHTTDLEEELERQEAGLEDHEEEVNSFVQNIDWDDLEREAMEDSELDGSSDGFTESSESEDEHQMKRRKTSLDPADSPGTEDGPKLSARSRMAQRMGISLEPADKPGDEGDSVGNSSGDEYYSEDRNAVKERLFAGIEDSDGVFVEDDESGNASELEERNDRQWGEDDQEDEENFDDLINNLEEEISSP
ncbi:CTD phosphatase Fcp1 [Coemansia sp. RSA 1250]|nr:CTD phosphatase Fcp1 [Coemansia sp. RSA 1250]